MKRQKMTMGVTIVWIVVVLIIIALFLGVESALSMDDTEGALLYTAVYGSGIIAFLLLAYGGMKRCYIEMGNDQLIVVRSVKKLKSDNQTPEGKWFKKKDTFDVKDIVRMGYTWDLYKRRMEYQRDVGEKLKDKEVVFELKNQGRSVVNLGLFTARRQIEIFNYIHERTGLWPEGSLKSALFLGQDLRKKGR